MNVVAVDKNDEEWLLPDLIEQQVAAFPQAVAVLDPWTRLSYAELSRRADHLARELSARLPAGPGAMVGVCLPRSVDLAVALLGVWRAGMAYVPLDPDHPAERWAWQLAESGAGLVLTDEVRGSAMAACGVDVDVLDPVCGGRTGSAPVAAARPAAVHPGSAAYVVFTSGSTGRPKGVVIDHRGLSNRVRWTVGTHALGAGDRVLQKTSLSFDAAAWEVFAPLVCGGTTVMAPPGAERDPAALLRAVADSGVTVLQAVPSVLRLLLDEPGWADCTALRLIFSAGEPLHAELCQRLLDRVPVEVWNTYGPTECSIDATAHRFDPAQSSGPVSIGRPLHRVTVRVLDPGGMPVPIGVPGELYIGGVGVARGYVGRPAGTAEQFLPDPFGAPGSRMYRTGDRVRWNEDGTLGYLGRLDDQVKVNGVRVEPAEVEAALLTHPDVGSTAVRAYRDAAGATRLAAYVLRRDVADTGPLRAFLRGRLPEALVPSAFVALDVFPTTTSGKVDRGALPAPAAGNGSGRPAPEAPCGPDEEAVARTWEALLGIGPVGAQDDFFQLGGSSLLMTRLASALSAATARDIAVADLFHATTVAAQARVVADAPVTAPPIASTPRDRPLPLSSGQRRQWTLDRMHPGGVEWLAPLVLTVPAEMDAATIQQALDALVARHEALRTRYPVGPDGEPRQIVDAPAPVVLRVVDVESGDAAAPDLVGLFGEELATGFDLEHGPLLRALLARRPRAEQLLLLTMHHIACDGWSTVVLESEFRELCAAFRAARPPALADVAVQYADFAVWQRARSTDDALRGDVDFWRRTLQGSGALHLPVDRPRPAERDGRGAVVSFVVPADLAGRVLGLGRERGATPFMTLLTAWSALLSRYCAQLDVPVGVPVSGRVHPQVESTVGFFLNSVVLRCDLSGAPSFVEALERVRDLSAAAFAHQSVPFDRLVEELAPARDPGRTPLYQVELDVHDESWTGTGIDLDLLRLAGPAWSVAKTDLCLYFRRTADGALTGVVEYATALFDEATMTRLAGHLTGLLEAVAAEPGTPLADLSFLPPGEVTALTQPWAPESAADRKQVADLLDAVPGAGEGSSVSVRDARGHLAPAGVAGEVHIAPAGPVGPWLPTGRRGLRRADGALAVLGRMADGARVRDRWVDPDAVRAALQAHPLVADAAVVPATGAGPDDDLRAYWVTAGAEAGPPGADELAAHCRERLQPHEVPREFRRLDHIPRTPDGALDRARLEDGSGPADLPGNRPWNAAEERIAALWTELLDTEPGVQTSFFGAGGNSILAIRLIAAVREEFGVDVSIRRFFENPTVATLAADVEEQIRAELADLSDSDVLAELQSAPDAH